MTYLSIHTSKYYNLQKEFSFKESYPNNPASYVRIHQKIYNSSTGGILKRVKDKDDRVYPTG